jgi:di/tricarboxylate transporter
VELPFCPLDYQSNAKEGEREKYIATWGSPLVEFFFAGFILAAAAKKSGLDCWMTSRALSRLGSRPAVALAGMIVARAGWANGS